MINEFNFSMNYIVKKLCRNTFVPRIKMKGIVITTEQRKKLPMCYRQCWRLHMNENFSRGTKTENEQTNANDKSS